MKIGSLIKTKKYIWSFLLNTLVLTLIGLSFSNPINKSFYSYETWCNCTSGYVAYDGRPFDKNYYYYYGDNVPLALSEGDGILVKADVYQFVDGAEYDEGSLLNKKNVVDGIYSALENNEIAIPETLASKYSLKLGDALYVRNSLKFKVQYIFRNLYNVKEASIVSDGNVVFVGFASPLSEKYVYAGFSNETAVFNEVYPFSKAKSEFLKTAFTYLGIISILALMVELVLILIYRKQEKANLYKDLISGSKTGYYQSLIMVNLLLHILPALIASTILASIRCYFGALAVIGVVLVLTLAKCAIFRFKVR